MLSNHRGKLLLVVSLAAFSSSLIGSSINVALPNISRELKIDATTLPWIATAFFLASAIILLPAGRLGDIYGRRRIFTLGLSVFTLVTLSCAFSNSDLMLILSRAGQGVGNALVISPGVAIISSAYPSNEKGKALGIYLAAVYLGLTMGPLIGGVITEQLGWRNIFFLYLPFGLFCLFLMWQMRHIPDEGDHGSFDLSGWVISAIAIFAIIYGLTLVPSVTGVWVFIAGLGAVVIFIWWERRTRVPLLDINLFRNNRIFVFSNLAALINYSATNSITLLISLYVQYIKGFSPQNAGLVLVAIPVIESLFSPIVGRWSDRVSSRNLASLGMLLSTVGLAMLCFIDLETSTVYIVMALAVVGFGLAFFVSPNTNAIMSAVPQSSGGVASATLATMRQMGIILSLGIVTVIFSIYIGQTEIEPAYYPAFLSGTRLLLGLFTALSFFGIFASYARGARKNS
jgi:EmrB/QacA subfamily drug resistance transporter